MADRLRYGAVAAKDDDLALLVFTPKGQSRYVSMTTEQAFTCIESLASVLRGRIGAKSDGCTHEHNPGVNAACDHAPGGARLRVVEGARP